MYGAVVNDFNRPPRYQQMPVPRPQGENEVLVDVLAAGLHPRVRSQANGSHYTSTDELPLVPGVDGVGRLADGGLVYFVLPDTTMGSMAEQTVIDLRRSVILADDLDPILLAAAMNPGMSSWVGLRRRLDFQPGCSVLVMGAPPAVPVNSPSRSPSTWVLLMSLVPAGIRPRSVRSPASASMRRFRCWAKPMRLPDGSATRRPRWTS